MQVRGKQALSVLLCALLLLLTAAGALVNLARPWPSGRSFSGLCLLGIRTGNGVALLWVLLKGAEGLLLLWLVLSSDFLFYYAMPGYSNMLERYIAYVPLTIVMSALLSVLLYRAVSWASETFKIDNGVI